MGIKPIIYQDLYPSDSIVDIINSSTLDCYQSNSWYTLVLLVHYYLLARRTTSNFNWTVNEGMTVGGTHVGSKTRYCYKNVGLKPPIREGRANRTAAVE